MAQRTSSSHYTQGHSSYTIATHQTRTAEVDAAFLLPHMTKSDHILDVGCGPGSITLGLAKCASEGRTVGVDISTDVLSKAEALAVGSHAPTEGPGSIIFEEGNIIQGLSYPDDSFDVIYCSQVLGHFPLPDLPVRALTEIRRVLKPGGILATRDGTDAHSYPRRFHLDRLWGDNQRRVLAKVGPGEDITGMVMPALFRRAGFDVDGGKVHVGAGTTVYSGPEMRKWLAWRATGQLQKGDPFYQSWIDAGITEDEVQTTLDAVKQWAETDDAWYASLQCEMLAWQSVIFVSESGRSPLSLNVQDVRHQIRHSGRC